MTKEIVFYYPENLDIRELLKKSPQSSTGKKLSEEKALCIIDSIIRARSKQEKQIYEKTFGYAKVSSKIMENKVHDYKLYLDFLESTGVIKINRQYEKGKECRKYKFTKQYRGVKFKEFKLPSGTLKRNIIKGLSTCQRQINNQFNQYSYLHQWWKTGKLSIDIPAAMQWIKDYEQKRIKDIMTEYKESETEERIKRVIDTSEDFKVLVNGIKGNSNIKFSNKSRRLYNPITNLKREIREFLEYDGQKMVEIDIKSCQPYMSLLLFKPEFWKDPNSSLGIFYKKVLNRKYIKEYINNNIIDSIIMFLKSLQSQYSKEFYSLEVYESEILKGVFYENLQRKLSIKHPDLFTSREKTKTEVLRILYFDTRKETLPLYSHCLTFKEYYPAVYDLFKIIKRNEYRVLPVLLQAIESCLMHDVVCKEISREFPAAPIFTVHDSILTTPEYASDVQEILRRCLKEYVGEEPQFGIKDYSARLSMAA